MDALDNGEHLAEALDREERNGADGRRRRQLASVGGPTLRDGGMAPIG
jgi:hypothetical protein